MTIYSDNYPYNIEAPQKLYIQYSHDIDFDYSTGKFPDGTEAAWHWENEYTPISHKINGLTVGKHEWMRIKVGSPTTWTNPIRMSADVTNIDAIVIEENQEDNTTQLVITLTFSDGTTKSTDPIIIQNGIDGIGISSLVIEGDDLVVTYTNGVVENLGRVTGEDAVDIIPTPVDGYLLSSQNSGQLYWASPVSIVNFSFTGVPPLSYSPEFLEMSISLATTTTDGYLSSSDWNYFASKLDAEADPMFTSWLSTTPPAYPGDIPVNVSDLVNDLGFISSYTETDPIFSAWLLATPPLYAETDPHSLHLDQSTPQTLISGVPLLSLDRVINSDYQIVDKKYVDDTIVIAINNIVESDPLSLHLDQSTPQTIINGIPLLSSDRIIDSDYQLVDKKYVDDNSGGSNLTFTNGLTESLGIVELGGILLKDTIIDVDTFTLSIEGSNGIMTFGNISPLSLFGAFGNYTYVSGETTLELYNSSGEGGKFELLSSQTIFTDSNPVSPEGIKYAADYSATFVDRSLVDKGYVDNAVSGVVVDETDPVFSAWLIATPPLYSETDPVFSAWLIATPPLYTETDPDFNAWLIATPPLYSESDPVFGAWLLNTPPAYPDDIITNHNDLSNIDGGGITNKYHSDQQINVANDVEFNSVRSTVLNSTELQRGADSKFGTGIPDAEKKKFKISVTYNAGTITALIQFVSPYTTFYYYINNVKFVVTNSNIAAYTANIAASEGLHFFYINQNTVNADTPVITLTKTPWGISDPDVLLWNFTFNATANEITWVGHEKHTYGRDIFNHARNHSQGAVYRSGLLLSQYNGITSAQLASNTDNNFGRAMVQIAAGTFFDEDLRNNIAHSDTAITAVTPATAETDWDKYVYQFLGFTAIADTGTGPTSIVFPSSRTLISGQPITVMQGNTTTVRGTTTITTGGTGTTFTVSSVTGLAAGDAIVVGGRIPIYYIASVAGSTYTWRKLTATEFLGVSGGAAITTANIGSATCQYNNAVSGGFTAMTANRYYPIYLLATNFTNEPVIAILGQGQSSNATLNTALGEAPFQFSNLLGLGNLEIQEVVPFYRLAFHYNTTAGFNQNRMRLVNATFINIRVTTTSASVVAPSASSDHATLSNRQWDLAGHSSGQVVPKLAGFDVAGLPTLYTSALYFDATVGTGGEYATVNDAYAAGKRKLLIVSDTALSADLTIDNLYIYLDNFTLSCTSYNFTINAGQVLTITGIGLITFAYSSTKILFNGNANILGLGNHNKTLTITNTSTTTNCRVSDVGNFDNLIVNLPNYTYVGFGSSVSGFNGTLNRLIINSGGGTCIPIFTSVSNYVRPLSKITINGPIGSITVFMITDLLVISTGTVTCAYGININAITCTLNVLNHVTNFAARSLTATSSNATFTNGSTSISVSITANGCTFTNVRFADTVTISGDSNKIIGSRVVGLLTLSSGADYNDISHNTLTGGLTNSSGVTTNIIHDNI